MNVRIFNLEIHLTQLWVLVLVKDFLEYIKFALDKVKTYILKGFLMIKITNYIYFANQLEFSVCRNVKSH
jgi:hypothetical protein